MLNPKSRSDNSDSATKVRRKALKTENPTGIRILEALDGRELRWLAEVTEISDSTLSGYIANGIASAEKAVAIGRALGRSVEWLITGQDRPSLTKPPGLVDALDADWIQLPKYDLRGVTDAGLGEPTLSVTVRRDWLYANFRTSSGLWLAKLLADYRPADLTEDNMVICRTIARNELVDGHLCIWRYDDAGIVIGRYSVEPDALLARGLARNGLPLGSIDGMIDPATIARATGKIGMTYPARDLVVAPSQIGDGDGQYHLVGRILGVFMRPIHG